MRAVLDCSYDLNNSEIIDRTAVKNWSGLSYDQLNAN